MLKRSLIIIGLVSIFAGCASVPTADTSITNTVKQFNAPNQSKAGLYVYRKSALMGRAIKKDIWVDDKCIGETAPGVFFYEQVTGNTEHRISTESEFSPNDLILKTDAGKNYFVEQYIKPGLIVGGAGLRVQDESKGKTDISNLELGIKGKCSK